MASAIPSGGVLLPRNADVGDNKLPVSSVYEMAPSEPHLAGLHESGYQASSSSCSGGGGGSSSGSSSSNTNDGVVRIDGISSNNMSGIGDFQGIHSMNSGSTGSSSRTAPAGASVGSSMESSMDASMESSMEEEEAVVVVVQRLDALSPHITSSSSSSGRSSSSSSSSANSASVSSSSSSDGAPQVVAFVPSPVGLLLPSKSQGVSSGSGAKLRRKRSRLFKIGDYVRPGAANVCVCLC